MAKKYRLILASGPLVMLFALTAACGGERPALDARNAGEGTDIGRFHKARCGACHQRVEPGERSRAYLERALTRHRKRVRASEAQWAELVEYLSTPKDAHLARAELTE